MNKTKNNRQIKYKNIMRKKTLSKKTLSKKTLSKKTLSKKTLSKKTFSKKTFSKKDYNSGDGMLTTIWGPNMWHYLHTVSFNYPVKPTSEDKKHYRDLILNMQYTLPCKYCRINLKNNFKIHPLKSCHMKSRDTFSRYVYRLHEIVNKMLKKNSGLSFCDVRERYEHFRSRCTVDEESKRLFKFNTSKKSLKKEKGCTEPLYGKKAKCVINIVPQSHPSKTLNIDNKCIKTRKNNI